VLQVRGHLSLHDFPPYPPSPTPPGDPRPVAPTHFQSEAIFDIGDQNPYKADHCVRALKFQTVVMADGIIAQVSGPWRGRRHTTFVFLNSQLPSALAALPMMPVEDGGEPIALYADSGYALHPRVFMPYPDGRFDDLHSAFNLSMSLDHISVEWGYERTRNLWQSLNFSTNLRIFRSPIAAWYICAVLFTNAVTCIEGRNIVSDHFGTTPPSLRSLFATLKY
jgi:hypothetical protein